MVDDEGSANPDLELVRGCLDEDPRAKETLHGIVAEVAARIRWAETEPAERVARIWTHIMEPGADGRRRLASYDGRGPLGGWIRVVATRLANQARRRTRSESAPEDALVAWWAAAATAERDVIKDMYVDQVREAFQGAVRALSEDDRLLLHMHYRQGITLEALTRVYGVHRVTLSRRVGAARRRIVDHAVAAMTEKTTMTEHECRSLLRTLQSRLDVSFGSGEA